MYTTKVTVWPSQPPLDLEECYINDKEEENALQLCKEIQKGA